METCIIYSIESFNSSSNKLNGIFLVNFNVRSFSKSFDVWSSCIRKLNIVQDVIIHTETRFSFGNTDNIPSYISLNSALSEEPGGGVSVILTNNLDYRTTEINYVSSESIDLSI